MLLQHCFHVVLLWRLSPLMVISSNVFKNKAFVVAFDDSAHFVEHHFKLLPLFISELLQTFFREHTSKIISHRWTCRLCLWLQRVWSVQAQSLTIKSVTQLLFWNVTGCALSRKRPGENKKCKLPELLPTEHSLRVQWKENRLSLCSCLAPATLFSSLKWNSRMDRRRTSR